MPIVFKQVMFYRIDSIAIMLGFWSDRISQNPSDLAIINVLMGICRYHIWKKRCCIKYGKEIINHSHSVNRLKFDIKTHLQALLLGSIACQKTKEILKSIRTNLNLVFSG